MTDLDLEQRLRALGARAGAGTGTGNGTGETGGRRSGIPDAGPLLQRAHRRRQAKLMGAGTALLAVVALSAAGLFAGESARESRVVSTPDPTVTAPTTSTTTAIVAGENAAPTTTVAPPQVPAGVPVSNTTTPQDDGAAPGLWIVSLDGRKARPIGTESQVAWSPDNEHLAVSRTTAANAYRIEIVAAGDGSLVAAIPTTTWMACLDWSSRDQLAWVDSSGAVHMVAMDDDGAPVASGPTRIATANAAFPWAGLDRCRWSPDGSTFALADPTRGAVRFYSAATGEEAIAFEDADVDDVNGLAWSPDGTALAVIVRSSGDVEDIVLLTGSDHRTVRRLGRPAVRVTWSPDSAQLYLRQGDVISSYSVEKGTVEVEAELEDAALFTPLGDGRFLAVTSGHTELRFVTPTWQRDGVLLASQRTGSAPCPGSFLSALRVSPDERSVVVAVRSRNTGHWRECAMTQPY